MKIGRSPISQNWNIVGEKPISFGTLIATQLHINSFFFSDSQMSSSSSNKLGGRFGNEYCGGSYGIGNYPRFCDCGLKVFVQTSWTEGNPGRRFVTCPSRNRSKCKFVYWCDPSICDRGKQIIPGLLKKINILQIELDDKHSKKKITLVFVVYYTIVVISFICVVLMAISPLYGAFAIAGILFVLGMILHLLTICNFFPIISFKVNNF
ncbi:hypothetical protein ABFX02_12G057100 [Erythranthe guttata]